MSQKTEFTGFIMTYNRTDILEETINTVLSQTYPPEKILIVDNGDDDKTKRLIESLNSYKI
jgi:glycosyltransferase involved in cell wall biosynthesis